MSGENLSDDLSMVAAADLSAKQYYFMKADTTAAGSKADVVSAAGADSIGVLQNDPTSGKTAIVRIKAGSVTKVVYGASITAGDKLKALSSGKAGAIVLAKVDTSDTGAAADPVIGSYCLGTALVSGADGEVGRMLWQPIGLVPTTAA